MGLTLLGGEIGLRPCGAATILKANNAAALNTGASWVNGVAPGSGDTAQWDAMVTGPSAVGLGGNLSWLGLNLGDYTSTNWSSPGGAVTITNTGNTLTLGAGGVNMSLAGTNLTLGATVQLGASQTWNVYNGLTLTLGTNVSGSGNLTKLGAGTVQFNGASGFSGTNIIGGGTVQLNFNGAGNPPLTNLLNPAMPLVFNYNGGLLQMLGTTNIQVQSFSNVLLLAGESGITVTPGAGTTTNYLGLGGLLRGTGGGVVNFSLASTNAFIQVTNSNVNGILGPWATYGPSGYNTATNLACVDANGFINPYAGWSVYMSTSSGLNPTYNILRHLQFDRRCCSG